MIQAYFFDMDGTLIDTEVLWVDATRLVLREFGFSIPYDEALEIVYGIPWKGVHAELTRRFSRFTLSAADMSQAVRPHFDRMTSDRDIRIEGSILLLERLARDYPIGIVSGAGPEDVSRGIALAGVGELLNFALSAADYPLGKPDPCGYLTAAGRLGLPPEQCLAFEDSAAGIAAAKGAGMHCVALARPGRPAQDVALADLVLEDLSQFEPEAYECG
jgi:beta-phosphoglucomutase-like phosphatase (HAD superfamily)